MFDSLTADSPPHVKEGKLETAQAQLQILTIELKAAQGNYNTLVYRLAKSKVDLANALVGFCHKTPIFLPFWIFA